MRNLKRALSLTLASVMLLGMMVIGTSAASYPDVDENDNVEAIEVLQAVGVMQGDDKGNFDPDRSVSRNEMAIIMAKLLNLDYNYYSESCPFWDVPDYAKPYVGACYANGIVSGYNANTYGGADTVTAVQAASMMMRALGYFKYDSDYKDGFVVSTVRQASRIGLFADINAGQDTPLTRNQVAQLALNALETAMVDAKDNTLNISGSTGDMSMSVSGGQVDYVIRTSTEKFAKAINSTDEGGNETDGRGGVTIELGEQLYQGALAKDDGDNGNTDAFGRPANHWEYEGREIGTYAHDADASFNAKVTSKALYNAVGSAAIDYTWYVKVDGEPVAYTGATLNTNKTDDNDCFLAEAGVKDAAGGDVTGTGNGVRTEVYVQGGNDRRVYVSVTHYYAAEVLRVNNANDDDRSITLSDLDAGPVTTAHVFETDGFAEDDFVSYSFADNAIQEVFATEKIEGKITQARALENNTNKDGDHFTVDSTKYNYNKTVTDGSPRRLTTENVNNNMVGYLDQYGYVIYIDDAAATYDYAYVLTMGSREDDYGSLTGTRATGDGLTWYARLVLTDGTIMRVQTDAKSNSLLHHIVSYSADSKGVYSLIDRSGAAIGGGAVKIDTGAAGIRINGTTTTANNNTVFVIADSDEEDPDEFNFRIYTGIQNVPDIKSLGSGKTVSVVAKGTGSNSNVAQVVYIQDADVSGTKNVIFIKADKNAKFDRTTDASRRYVITAVEDGEVVELLVKEGSLAAEKLVTKIIEDAAASDPDRNNVFIVAAEYLTRDSDDIVTNVKLYDWKYDPDSSEHDDGYVSATGTVRAKTGTVGLGGDDDYGYSDKTIVVRYDVASGDFYPERNINGIKDDKDDHVLGIVDTGSLTGICYLNDKSGSGEKPEGGGTIDPGVETYTVKYTINGGAEKTETVKVGQDFKRTVDGDSEITAATAGTISADKKTLTVTQAQAEGVTINITVKTVELYTMTAPTGVVYSVDEGKTWNSSVEIKSEKDFEIWMKPAEEGFFFKAAPKAVGNTELAKAIAGAGGTGDQAATSVTGQSGVYKFTLANINGTTFKITETVRASDVKDATVVKLTDTYVVENGASSKVYLRFEDASGVRDTSVSLPSDAKVNTVGDAVSKLGYKVTYDGTNFTLEKGYSSLTVADGDVNTAAIRYWANTKTDANKKLAVVGDTINVGDNANPAVIYDKDGKVVGDADHADTITCTAAMDDCLIVEKTKSSPAEKTANTKAPAAERDETIKLESTNNTDKTGFLKQDSDAYTGSYDYSKATGKLTTAHLKITCASDDVQFRITQTNEALKIVDGTNTRVTPVNSSAIGSEISTNDGNWLDYEFLVMEGGGNITIKIERWKDGETAIDDASTSYTITIDPSTMTFK